MGPVTRARLDDLAALGVIQTDTLVREGEEGPWRSYEVPSAFGDSAPPPLQFPCVSCGSSFPPNALLTFEGKHLCGACKVSFFQHLKQGTWIAHHEVSGMLWKRALAKLLDVHILVLLFSLFSSWMDELGVPPVWSGLLSLMAVGGLLAFFVYSTVHFGGTPGKRLFRLAVVDQDDRRLGYGQALTRTFAELISVACLTMGYLMALIDPERMTLHDRICQTRVVSERAVLT